MTPAILILAAALSASSADTAALLGAWGTSDPKYDLNADGTVNAADLAIMLGSDPFIGPPAPAPEHVPGVAVRYDDVWLGFHTIGAFQPVIIRRQDIRQMWGESGDATKLVVWNGESVTLIVVDCPIASALEAVR